MITILKSPTWLRVDLRSSRSKRIGVDRDSRVIHGFVVAEEGPFRSEGRGMFDRESLSEIHRLMLAVPAGLKSHFAHPTLSDDGLGKFLGRARNPRLDEVIRGNDTIGIVRADLHLSDTAFEGNPNGNLGEYVMDLAEEDSDALGASLVLRADKEVQVDEKGRPLRDKKTGEDLPPIWRPKQLHAIDLVDAGDATRSFLAIENLPDEIVRRASSLLDRQFVDADRETIEARCKAWLSRYLNWRFGDAVPEPERQVAGRDPKIRRARNS